MVYLVSTTHHLLAIDTDRRKVFRIHSGGGLYYGLAFSEGRVYVGCRNDTRGPDNEKAREQELGCVLILHGETLETVDVLYAPFPLRDVHGLCCHNRRLWITCSFDNMIAVHNLVTGAWERWYPSQEESARGRDIDHFNSVVELDGKFGIVAHRFGESQLILFHSQTLALEEVIPLGVQAHDVFLVEGALTTCSSGEGALRSTAGWALRTGGFPRGYAVCGRERLLGLSQCSARADRSQASSVVRVFDEHWLRQEDYVLRGAGMVLALLPLPVAAHAAARREQWDEWDVIPNGSLTVIRDAYELAVPLAAARSDARMPVIVNPEDRKLVIQLGTAPYSLLPVEVVLAGHTLGIAEVQTMQSAGEEFVFELPPGLRGNCELSLRTPRVSSTMRHHDPSSEQRFLENVVLNVALR